MRHRCGDGNVYSVAKDVISYHCGSYKQVKRPSPSRMVHLPFLGVRGAMAAAESSME